MTASPTPLVSVVVPTHNPGRGRLQRTLAGLRAQTLPVDQWETVLVDNSSTPALASAEWSAHAPSNFRIVPEPALGLTQARRRGFIEARGSFSILVDDDNVLAPDYLASVIRCFDAHPGVGALGGRSLPEFEEPPAAWIREFDSLLALRDLGNVVFISNGLKRSGAARNEYPPFAPIGAGMALRREAWTAWTKEDREQRDSISDRRGTELTSGGDNDIIFCAMKAGWEVGYFPELSLTHLIPRNRLEPRYLARLNRGIQKSWMQVLSLHAANAWPPLSATSAKLRQIKAWFSYHAWSSPAARIRWQGACGHFEGRIKL